MNTAAQHDATPGDSPGRVLVVDDHPQARESIAVAAPPRHFIGSTVKATIASSPT